MARIQTLAWNFTAANQFSPWLKHDYYEEPFCVSLAVYFGFGLAATLKAQYLLDDLSRAAERQVSFSQSLTTITVNDSGPVIGIGSLNANGAITASVGQPGHGLAVGDYVELNELGGGFNVASVVSATQYTLTSALSQTLAQQMGTARSGRVFDHATLAGLTARASGNYAFPVYATRLTSTAFTSAGYAYLVAAQGGESS